MSKQQKDSTHSSPGKPSGTPALAGAPQPETSTETSPQALLQAAVKAAKEKAVEKAPESRPAPAPAPAPAPRPANTSRPALVQVAGVALMLGLGWVGGWATFMAAESPAASASKAVLSIDWKALAAGLEQSQGDALRLSGDIRTLRGGVESLKEAIDQSKQETAAKLAQVTKLAASPAPDVSAQLVNLAERLDRLPRSEADAAAQLAKAIERLEQAEGGERETGARLSQIVERLDRIERQASAKPVAAPAPAPVAASPSLSAPAEGPAHTASVAEAKAPPKPASVDGWVLHDVYNGLALVEGKNQRLLEIGPGDTLPGVGRVEAIERRGKSWVVLTSKGVISSQQW